MSVNVDKLKDGLSNYNDSLKKHLEQLQTNFTTLQSCYIRFTSVYGGRKAEELKFVWQEKIHWFESYITKLTLLSKLLEERISELMKLTTVNLPNFTKSISSAKKSNSIQGKRIKIELSEIRDVKIDELEKKKLHALENSYDSFYYQLNESKDPIALSGAKPPYDILNGRHRVYLARKKGYKIVSIIFA